MIRVLLVDDEIRLLQAWERAFSIAPEFALVGTRPHADGLDVAVETLVPDVVVIDLSMPGVDAIDTIRRFGKSHASVRFVVHSANSDPSAMDAAFDAGAWGYVDKLAATSEMFDALRRVARGEAAFPPNRLASQQMGRPAPRG